MTVLEDRSKRTSEYVFKLPAGQQRLVRCPRLPRTGKLRAGNVLIVQLKLSARRRKSSFHFPSCSDI